MRSRTLQVFLCLGLLAGPAAVVPAQEDDPAPADSLALPPAVTLEPPAVTVSWAWIVPGPDGQGELLVAAPPADAAGTLERLGTVRFRYEGDGPAGTLEIEAPVPPELEYVPDSATGPGAEAAYLAESRRVRWSLPGPLEPGTAGLVSFRARPRPLDAAEDAGETR